MEYSVQLTAYSVQCTVYSVQCTDLDKRRMSAATKLLFSILMTSPTWATGSETGSKKSMSKEMDEAGARSQKPGARSQEPGARSYLDPMPLLLHQVTLSQHLQPGPSQYCQVLWCTDFMSSSRQAAKQIGMDKGNFGVHTIFVNPYLKLKLTSVNPHSRFKNQESSESWFKTKSNFCLSTSTTLNTSAWSVIWKNVGGV